MQNVADQVRSYKQDITACVARTRETWRGRAAEDFGEKDYNIHNKTQKIIEKLGDLSRNVDQLEQCIERAKREYAEEQARKLRNRK